MAKPKYIMIHPELYLIILLLPWQLWFLTVVIYPNLPKAIDVLILKKQLCYITPDGEIIFMGYVKQQKKILFSGMYISVKCARFGWSTLTLTPTKTTFTQ